VALAEFWRDRVKPLMAVADAYVEGIVEGALERERGRKKKQAVEVTGADGEEGEEEEQETFLIHLVQAAEGECLSLDL
jgi:molybdopterin-guanine dinucleotide biosynthesis protein A